jgi:hypothetical protein
MRHLKPLTTPRQAQQLDPVRLAFFLDVLIAILNAIERKQD